MALAFSCALCAVLPVMPSILSSTTLAESMWRYRVSHEVVALPLSGVSSGFCCQVKVAVGLGTGVVTSTIVFYVFRFHIIGEEVKVVKGQNIIVEVGFAKRISLNSFTLGTRSVPKEYSSRKLLQAGRSASSRSAYIVFFIVGVAF